MPATLLRARVSWQTAPRRCLSSLTPPTTHGLLQHHHLNPGRLTPYDDAHALQESIRAELLAHKAGPNDQPAPPPRLISFESTPTFTLGRRQSSPSEEETARLRKPLRIHRSYHDPDHTADGTAHPEGQGESRPPPLRLTPDIRATNRGGLTTYHGPGQLVLWPVLDMRSPLHAPYGVESYASHLESTTQRLLSSVFGIRTYISRDDPGVWISVPGGATPRKIAALGVHHRRHVTALGVALNLDVPVSGIEPFNPWARFVPCGLDGALVSSVAAETGERDPNAYDVADLARQWAALFAEGLQDPARRGFDGARV